MSCITWIYQDRLVAEFQQHIAEHSRVFGEKMASALDSPRSLHHYAAETDLYVLAAVYAHRLVKAHPLVDGNKRLALYTALVFLALNNAPCGLAPGDADDAIVALAAGEIGAVGFARSLRPA